MEVLYFLLSIVFAIYIIYTSITYYQKMFSLKRKHAEKARKLQPIRKITEQEIERFKKIYKKNVSINTPVYKVKGAINCLTYKNRYNEHKQYSIDDVRINWRSTRRLAKKDVGMNLSTYNPKAEEIHKKLMELNELVEAETISKDEIQKRMVEIEEQYCQSEVEFAFAEADIESKPAYLLSVDDWKL